MAVVVLSVTCESVFASVESFLRNTILKSWPKYIAPCFVWGLVFAYSMQTQAQDVPAPTEAKAPSVEELIALVEHARSQITSYDVVVHISSAVEDALGDMNTTQISEAEIMESDGKYFLKDKGRKFSTTPGVPEAGGTHFERSYLATEFWSKSLNISAKNDNPWGTVELPDKSSHDGSGPMEVMFKYFSVYQKQMHQKNTQVIALENGMYSVTTTLREGEQKGIVRFTIDPEKNYVPVKSEVVDESGHVMLANDFKQFEEAAPGIWLPTVYEKTIHFPSEFRQLVKVSVDILSVNQPLDESEFTLVFPPGTRVRDNIAGYKYEIGAANMGSLTPPVVDMEFDIDAPAHESYLSELVKNELAIVKPERLAPQGWGSTVSVVVAICSLGVLLGVAVLMLRHRRAQ